MNFSLITVKVGQLFDGTQEKKPVHEMCNLKEEIVNLLQRAHEEQENNSRALTRERDKHNRVVTDLNQKISELEDEVDCFRADLAREKVALL